LLSLSATIQNVVESSCVLERDVPWRGRIFYSRNFLCFYGKHNDKSAKVIIPWREVLAIEKKMTAGVFPNAIRVHALHTKYFFVGFPKRDAVYLRLKDLWEQRLKPLVCLIAMYTPPCSLPRRKPPRERCWRRRMKSKAEKSFVC